MAKKKAVATKPQPLSAMQELFAVHYAQNGNQGDAAIAAGYSPNGASERGRLLLKKAEVRARVKEIQAETASRLSITKDMVLREWWAIVQADPNELTQIRRGCCRHCWGDGFMYQWKEGEYQLACDEAIKMEKPLPDDSGGMGYNQTRPPHPDCPECYGEGILRTWFADTNKVSDAAKKLFAGVQETQSGIKINMHSKLEALKEIGKLLGFYETKGGDALGFTQNNTVINNTTNVLLESVEREIAEAFGNIIEGTPAKDEDSAG